MAVNKWPQYLTVKPFVIKTDQKALKFLLEQKLHTGNQLKWIIKLMQYDFEIEYKKGKENKAADALSRLPLKGMKEEIQGLVKNCDVCQRHKYDNAPYPRLLQPLLIPESAWSNISMDFIEGLTKSQGKSIIWVVVDRLTKYAHFIGLSHPYFANELAKIFMEQLYNLHGLPEDIISDRDPIFTRAAEWWYNTTFHSSIQCTLYEALYGKPLPLHLPYAVGDSHMEEVDRSLLTREFKVQLLKYHLKRAQQRMVNQANKHRSDRQFE
ncbi:uncharacterized protein LOC142162239 [Nicotiana tabacum]|uniref:Uncharacterized protein LOC142162239 n=1 Tax=Nicotiana tabacum TaxID=4097 RepID=A0AC58RPK8_TOBAC